MPSFDIVSRIEMPEVDNAVQSAMREINTRYDFKGSASSIERTDQVLQILADDELKLKQVQELLRGHMAKRKVDIGALDFNAPEKAFSNSIRQNVVVKQGIERELAQKIIKIIKGAKIKVQVNNKTRIEEFLGDGCLISTPAGSSAYNLSLRGPVIPVGAQVLALTPISPYRPRRWRGALLNNNAKITLLSLDKETRPVRAEADFLEFDNIVKLEVLLDKTKYMNLLFDPGHDMEERIVTEQFNN